MPIYQERLRPILKWAGGKSSELPVIHQYLPNDFNNFYEPFLGGGAVWLSIDVSHKMFVNDFSEDLVNFYKNIKEEDVDFFYFLEEFSKIWDKSTTLSKEKNKELINLYSEFRDGLIKENDLIVHLDELIFKHISFFIENENLLKFLRKYTVDKFKRTKNNELKKGALPQEDYIKNIETGIKGSLYMFIRHLYNENKNKVIDNFGYSSACYFIIRDLCYSGMFRFNKEGKFNVPYGGIGYNKKCFKDRVKKLKNKKLINHFKNTDINNNDFMDFLRNNPPESDDFIFLDPPYDTEFSSYDNNEFDKKDQKRLAEYLINECKGKWMVVIKHTDFIYDLYNKKGIEIIPFDKRYAVSFMDRNKKDVTHILIRNYENKV